MPSLQKEIDRKLKAELIRARNREKIATSKLDCLKARYEKVYDQMMSYKSALTASHHHCEELQARVEKADIAETRSRHEAAAWKAKAMEKMEELEQALEQVRILEHELELTWERSSDTGELKWWPGAESMETGRLEVPR